MRPLRRLLPLLCAALLALPLGVHSQLRPAEVAPVAPAQQGAPAREEPATQEEAAESRRFYDPANPDLGRLQHADELRARLPQDKRGAVDWMAALRSGAIKPRADLNGDKLPQVMDHDIVLKNTKEMPWVKFPHKAHTEWLDCGNCHSQLFVPKAGANAIDMNKIFRGEACGACHGKVAFTPYVACERCHSIPQGNTKAWW